MLSQTAEYALRAASSLAEHDGARVPSHHLAALTGVPPDYLAKVLGLLVKAGVVSATRGRNGGVRLTRPASEISLLEVVNAVDPVRRLLECPLGRVEHREQLCPLHQQIDDAVAMFEQALATRRLGDLFPAPTVNAAACDFPRSHELATNSRHPATVNVVVLALCLASAMVVGCSAVDENEAASPSAAPEIASQTGQGTGPASPTDLAESPPEAGTGPSMSLVDAPATPLPAADLRQQFDLRALPRHVPYPPENPPLPERVALGRLLFFDPILSGERDVACATCHHPDLGWADGRQLGIGVAGGGVTGLALGPDRLPGLSAVSQRSFNAIPRNAPTVLNTAFNGNLSPEPTHNSLMFWDGRMTKGLEAQAMGPITSREEMAGDSFSKEQAVDALMARLRDLPEYEAYFRQAFPETGSQSSAITATTYAQAIAAFERTLITPNAPFDRFAEGDDMALSDPQKRGLALFFGRAGCRSCHSGPMFSDYSFHALGVTQQGPGRPASPGDDIGRAEVTQLDADRYAFRTPSLRNVALTAPYMHDGILLTLRDVVAFFNDGANDRGLSADTVDPRLHPLGLSDPEMDDLVAFLESLTGDQPKFEVPRRVPSGLEPVFGVPAMQPAGAGR